MADRVASEESETGRLEGLLSLLLRHVHLWELWKVVMWRSEPFRWQGVRS